MRRMPQGALRRIAAARLFAGVLVLAVGVAGLAARTRAGTQRSADRASASATASADAPPNIVFILADDLGYGELGVYGQTRIKTPRLDRLAAQGMRFTQFYAGSPVCAPSRGTFLTGKHTGHAVVRDNKEYGGFADDEERGQLALPAGEPTVAEWLSARGYATAAIGKWGLGGPGSVGLPTRHGFDLFYGYLDQKQAHNYYPTHLWRNETRAPLDNAYFSPHQKLQGDPNDPASYAAYSGTDYAIDRMTREAARFITDHKAQRFFLYFAPTLPHVALQAPASAVAPYLGQFEETPYTGDKNYLPNRTPRATYAAMISYLDAQVGQLLDTLEAAGLADRTLVIFTSDNGATFDTGGAQTRFFHSVGDLRGWKQDVYEGGIRVPFIARWPGHIAPGSVTPHVAAMWDMWATFADLQPAATPPQTDGISLLPTLLGRGTQREHDALYWEYHSQGSAQAVRMGRWKGVRTHMRTAPEAAIELYDLDTDPGETKNVAAQHADVVSRIDAVMKQRTRSAIDGWNFEPAPATGAPKP
jgi:arylsulfatase A-like enzyme